MHEQFLSSIDFIKTYDNLIPSLRHKTDNGKTFCQSWELKQNNDYYYLDIRKNNCELSFLKEGKNHNKILAKFKLRSLKFMLKRYII